MKICFVGPANSSHLIKWCNWFTDRGHDVHIISFTSSETKNGEIHLIDVGVNVNGSDFWKIKYLTTGNQIRRLVNEIQPDIVSVHYATSYGIAVALSGVKNYVLSVWGSDIYDFPRKSIIHELLLKYSLYKASFLFSTSKSMAKEANKYTKKSFAITPFGVDLDIFNPHKRTRSEYDNMFIFGTVKSLTDIYGIEYILRAAAIIKNEYSDIDFQIRIAGDGPDSKKYKELVEKLNVKERTVFLGRITQEQAAVEWANMDVAVIPSVEYESFGVAAVEAQASGTPVIISDVEGLKETTEPGKSSVIVNKKNERDISNALIGFYKDPVHRKEMGRNGRRYVCSRFEINHTFAHIEELFKEIYK